MKIAIDCLLLYGAFSGVQHAILHQVRGLLNLRAAHEYVLVALRDAPIEEWLGPTRKAYEVIRAPIAEGERLKRVFWEQTAMPAILAKAGVDLLYAPGYLTSLRWHGPSVVLVHDTIALSHPHLCTLSNTLNYQVLLPPSARHATCVAVPSQASARDVAKYCHVPEQRIRTVPLGVADSPEMPVDAMADIWQRLGVRMPYLLAVSTIEPKKNFASLIRWFNSWKRDGLPHMLVIAGKWGWGTGGVRRALARSPFREQILMPGYLERNELTALLAGAELLLMPSLYEGFGLPVLEAMAAGTPVAISDRGALPETAGNAGLVLPLDEKRWIAEIPLLLNDPKRLHALHAAGRKRAAAMSWQRTAEALLAVLEEAGAE